MAKNYTIQYLSVLKEMLDDAASEVETLIEQADTGIPDNPPAAKKALRAKMQELDDRFQALAADVRKLNYTDFKTKHIEHL